MLGQSEASILVKPHLPSKIYQGITTEITGEGSSAAPLTDALRKSDRAVGVSTSLQYAPAPYATTDELIALTAEGATLGGIYATHMRNEGDAIVPALQTVSGSTSQRTSGIAFQMLKMSGLPCCSDLWARTGSWHSPHRPLVRGRTL
jgi:N-acyl-D-aspartate/D-glutamate deacylase